MGGEVVAVGDDERVVEVGDLVGEVVGGDVGGVVARLGADIIGTLDRIYDFLGLDSPGYPPEVYGLYNTAEEKRALPGWVMALRRGPLVRALRRLPAGPRQRLVQMAWQRTGQAVEKPALRAVLKPDVDRLRELTGQDFASWSL